MTDKVEIDLEDLDDLKDILGEERQESTLNFQKVFKYGVLLISEVMLVASL